LATYPPTIPHKWHIPFFPTTSASTWTSICHPEYVGSMFLWKAATLIYYTVQKPKKDQLTLELSCTFWHTFLSHCWWRYRRRILVFSVTITEKRRPMFTHT
jgi:hypothetical protein